MNPKDPLRAKSLLELYHAAPLNSVHDEETVGLRTGYRPSSMQSARIKGTGPAIPYVDMGPRNVGYVKLHVEEWILSRPLKRSTSDPGVPLRERHPLDQWMALSRTTKLGNSGSQGGAAASPSQ